VTNHRRTHEQHVEAIRKAHDSGVVIIAGSDSGLTNFPQGGALEEICAYVEVIGMSPHEALLTATRDANRVIGFDDAGTLEPGKRADLIVLGENPLERIRAIAEPGTVEAVLQGGEVVSGALEPAAAVTRA
jgi:imidazolonepropionase-like amidohydrolase